MQVVSDTSFHSSPFVFKWTLIRRFCTRGNWKTTEKEVIKIRTPCVHQHDHNTGEEERRVLQPDVTRCERVPEDTGTQRRPKSVTPRVPCLDCLLSPVQQIQGLRRDTSTDPD